MRIRKFYYYAFWAISFLLVLTMLYRQHQDRAEITFTKQPSAFAAYTLRVEATDGKHEREFDDQAFSRNKRGATEPMRTKTKGLLHVSFAVAIMGHETVAETLIIPLKPDWRWNVVFFITDQNPYKYCMGCDSYEMFDIPGANAYKLYVVTGGNYIKHPVEY
ncbi:MAG TPA: hypothetical protein VF260_04005 [Bacilli bacterium]